MEYATGDHLGVLPRNNVDLIRRVIARFGLDAGTYLTITPTGGGSYTHLPLGEPTPLLGMLGSCVELQDIASRSDLAVLARYATDPDERAELVAMSAIDEAGKAAYRERVAAPRRTVLDLLDEYPSCDLPFEVYLDLLPPLRPRYYSISSSPAATSTCAPDGRSVAWSGAQRRGGVLRRRLRSPGGRYGGQHGVHVRAQTDNPLPATGEPACPDDHGWGGHGNGPVPGLPAGAGRPQTAGCADRGVDLVLRLPGLRDRLPLRR